METALQKPARVPVTVHLRALLEYLSGLFDSKAKQAIRLGVNGKIHDAIRFDRLATVQPDPPAGHVPGMLLEFRSTLTGRTAVVRVPGPRFGWDCPTASRIFKPQGAS